MNESAERALKVYMETALEGATDAKGNPIEVPVMIGFPEVEWISKHIPCVAFRVDGFSEIGDYIPNGLPLYTGQETVESKIPAAWLVGYVLMRARINIVTRERSLLDRLTMKLIERVLTMPYFSYGEYEETQDYQIESQSGDDSEPVPDEKPQSRIFERVLTWTVRGPLILTSEEYPVEEFIPRLKVE